MRSRVNHTRLAGLKAKCDPDNFFNLIQNAQRLRDEELWAKGLQPAQVARHFDQGYRGGEIGEGCGAGLRRRSQIITVQQVQKDRHRHLPGNLGMRGTICSISRALHAESG